MTAFDSMLRGGDSGAAAIAPKDAAASAMVAHIKGVDGKAVMPPGGNRKLTADEISTIERWIQQGANNDALIRRQSQYDDAHPPAYSRLPVISSLDVSPDGQFIAVAGFHEVLLHRSDGSGIAGRLIGLSERIESVKFSPEGDRLAVAAGLPGRMGEIQIWDVAKRKLKLSLPMTADTLYGVSWSPDGKSIAFGCGDTAAVRVIDAGTGQQTLFQGAHSDWVLGTVFSADGSHLVSVGRDRSCKLIEVATQRFVDNITSITPGALRGGLLSVARHPRRDEVVVAGADGQPKVYRMHRQTIRVIGDDGNLIRELPSLAGRIWSVAVSADGQRIVAGAGIDGKGEVAAYGYEFDTKLPERIKKINEKVVTTRTPVEIQELDAYHRDGVKQLAKSATPATVYAVAFFPDGQRFAAAGSDGMMRVYATESATIVNEWPAVPVTTSPAMESEFHPDYIRDVAPVLSRLGCNAGTCHGSKEGKNGFKLSLRGYDPVHDIRAFTDEHAARRISVASPDDSLMLLKCTGQVPHVGGQLTKPGEKYYQILRAWIADGGKLNPDSPRVSGIAITPSDPVLDLAGRKQQFQVVATFADGATRDVTQEAFLESGNTEVAKVEGPGLATAIRRGEAPILARYEGAYAATTMTVMGDRAGFVWTEPPKWNKIDEFTAAKWQRLKTLPSELSTDAEFLRRVSLDLTGMPPTADAVRAFLADARPTQVKRDELIDRLIGSADYIEHWTNKWADLLQVNRKFLGVEGATALRSWIRRQLADNVPYDRFAASVITATGSNREHPPAGYFKVLRQPAETMENTTHLFLGVRFNCNKCHDHPFERWTQDQYYQTAAFFAQFALKKDPASGDRRVGGSEVESAQPLFEKVVDQPQGEIKHDRTGAETAPAFPYPAEHADKPGASRRERLAAWMTTPANRYFARSYVNRLWGYLFGVGLIEPIDDIRAGNPPSNSELLDFLTQEFIQCGFNVRHMHRLICQSRTYQLSLATNKWNDDDKTNYSHALARRLPAEVIYDAAHRATGAATKIPGLASGARAAEIPDSGVELPGGFLNTLGRPPRESACECERTTGLQIGPIMALVSGPVLNDAIADPHNAIAKLAADQLDDGKLIEELYLRILNRPALATEIDTARKWFTRMDSDHDRLVKALAEKEKEWSPIFVRLQEERDDQMNQARAALEDYRAKEYEPRQKELEAERQTRIASAQAALKDYDAKINEYVAAWSKQHAQQPEWYVLKPGSIKGNSKDTTFKVEADGSILVEGGQSGLYTLTAETSLTGITAIRVEALADGRLPSNGPGRAHNGNFVLNELELSIGTEPVKLHKPLADFSQAGFGPAEAINGRRDGNDDGWAAVPRTGEDHWATFEVKDKLGPGALTFKLHQNYSDKQHAIGRFRISVTTASSPGLSLPEHVIAALRRAAAERSDEQKKLLASYQQRTDSARDQLVGTVANAMKPLPPDAKLEHLKLTLAEAEKPVPLDPKLAQLRADAKLSAEQLKNKRLIAAQDVTWALINSPAFLFNR